MKRFLTALVAICLAAPAPPALHAQERGAVALGELLGGLHSTVRVLMIAAHPDDEDTPLIAWLARARHAETAYLSLTRGDGGQNLIGNELGEGLGVIRTEELLAARRIDGGHQYFTRAYDFGYSRSAEETFRHWPRDSLLRDVVTVVRAFRPHVIVAVFTGTGQDGHGQHQVAGLLTREAYEIAGNGQALPPSATGGYAPWTPLKLYQTMRGSPGPDALAYNAGEYSPLLGRSFAEMAAESRSQHRSQGFGVLQPRGTRMAYVRREHTRVNAGTAAGSESSIFDGIENGWQRFRAVSPAVAAAIDSLEPALDEARNAFDALAPHVVIPELAAAQRHLDALCAAAALGCTGTGGRLDAAATTRADLDRSAGALGGKLNRAVLLASGVLLEAVAMQELGAVSSQLPVEATLYNRGVLRVDVTHIGGSMEGAGFGISMSPQGVPPGGEYRASSGLWADYVTVPWWLRTPRNGAMFTQPIPGVPDNERPQSGRIVVDIRVEGARAVATAFPVVRYADPVFGDMQRPLRAVPAISVLFDRTVEIAPAGEAYRRRVDVSLRSAVTDTQSVTVRLQLPAGVLADSASKTVRLPPGGMLTVPFGVSGTLPAGRHVFRAIADTGGAPFTRGYTLIDYPHIRPQHLYREAEIAVSSVDVRIPRTLNVAYIPGVGDNVAPILRQLGITLAVVQPGELADIDLSRFTTIVVGPRAYDASEDLVAANSRLLEWVHGGGTMVVQYGQYEMMRPGIMPFPITISRPHDRVTEEDAPVGIIDRDAPLLNTPNRIAQGDFDGWVQERSLYMPRTFDPRYSTMLSISDPGEPPGNGAILSARHGAGTYIYTTLAFFRQLPAGVPGAARLFVNLLAAGQPEEPGEREAAGFAAAAANANEVETATATATDAATNTATTPAAAVAKEPATNAATAAARKSGTGETDR